MNARSIALSVLVLAPLSGTADPWGINAEPFADSTPPLVEPVASSFTDSAMSDLNDPTRVIERGRYLVKVSGCNDCHTEGYMQGNGEIPTEQWLTGSAVGFQGPWGTTYPTNLRLLLNELAEADWLVRAREPKRPPMPWFNLSAMTDADLVAIYRFVRSLGPAGEPAPVAAAPGDAVATPYFDFVPKALSQVVTR
ncbi:c-type cytochrome [Thiocapsa sp.]|uniref:c-type cytochrome n=1 Tax=Thiocapsa sp. TaxID=2024551 RepID=UPI0025D46AED|nr:c-type cytochrome [Thiocapsa sp.]